MDDEPAAMTLEELVAKLEEAAPYIDDKVADMLGEYPHLRAPDGGFMLGRIVAMSILDFLPWAFGKGHLGYVPPQPDEGRPQP